MTQHSSRIRIILTGATGMVGEGVLHECLQDPRIEKILVVGRRSCENKHPKIAELIIEDFFNLSAVEDQLVGYQGCLFCLGVSSLGMKEAVYKKLTYDLTLHFAQSVCRLQPGMTFCYISGAGTDSTEKGRVMWARVKGRTENALLRLPFTKAYNFRPALLSPTPGLKNTLAFYHYLNWLFPIVRRLAPKTLSSLQELGQAMINVLLENDPKKTLEVSDIHRLSRAYVSSRSSLVNQPI